MFASALRWNWGNCSFDDFKQSLLYAFSAYIAGYRSVFAFSADFVDFVNKDDSAFCSLNISVCGVDQLKKDIFYVFADIACFRKSCCVCNCKRNVQFLSQCFCEKGFSASCWSYKKNVWFFDFYLVFAVGFKIWERAWFLGCHSFIMIVNCNRKNFFCVILAYNVLIKIFLEFFWRRNIA